MSNPATYSTIHFWYGRVTPAVPGTVSPFLDSRVSLSYSGTTQPPRDPSVRVLHNDKVTTKSQDYPGMIQLPETLCQSVPSPPPPPPPPPNAGVTPAVPGLSSDNKPPGILCQSIPERQSYTGSPAIIQR